MAHLALSFFISEKVILLSVLSAEQGKVLEGKKVDIISTPDSVYTTNGSKPLADFAMKAEVTLSGTGETFISMPNLNGFNPVELTEYACNMSLFLMTKIQEELPDKYENTFIIYNKWDERYRTYPNTVQSQVQKLFEKTFGNILDIRLANCYSFNRYTHFDERLKFSAKSKGTVRLVQAVNDLVDQITREKNFIEEF